MLRKVDELLNSITMYRLILYYLIFLLLVSFVLSFFGIFPFTPLELVASTLLILSVSWITNHLFARILKVQTNLESVYITSLILSLLVLPSLKIQTLLFTVLVAFISQASKYLVNLKHKHIFNPAAFALFVTGILFNRYGAWWIGSADIFVFLLLGFLVVRKTRRFSLVLVFFAISLVSILARGTGLMILLPTLVFFATVILIEPLTSPTTYYMQIIYALIVGLVFAIFGRIEIALVVGNIFAFIISPRIRFNLNLEKINKLTNDTYEFVFISKEKLKFKAGQYLEWTLSQEKPDTRGTRRFFTIASSPTENEIKIGLKLPDGKVSSFKTKLMNLKRRDKIIISQLAGDFTLPKDTNKKLVLVAGGIGITPFRSMIKYLVDIGEKRDIVLMYSEKNIKEFVYKDVFESAIEKIGLRVIYFETERQGHMTSDLIKSEVNDYKERTFYLSGPHAMVVSFEDGLAKLGIKKTNIKVDYFPGY